MFRYEFILPMRLTWFLFKVSPEVRDPTHAVKVKAVFVIQGMYLLGFVRQSLD